MKSLFLSFLIAICLVSPLSAGEGESPLFKGPEPLLISTKAGDFKFQVEIADTDESRRMGLMFRETMPPKQGMLFVFQQTAPVAMWMENTLIPLDMIFIKPDGTVRRVEHDTTPKSRKVISSGGPVSHVLELNAGTSRLIGLTSGSIIHHSMFGNAQ